MLEEQDDRRDRQLGCEGRDEAAVDGRRPDVLKASRDVLQNFDGIFARLALAVAAVEPGRDRENDDDERVAEGGDEEEQAFCV